MSFFTIRPPVGTRVRLRSGQTGTIMEHLPGFGDQMVKVALDDDGDIPVKLDEVAGYAD